MLITLIYRDVYERPPLLRCPHVFWVWVAPNNGGVLAAAIRHQVIHVALPRHVRLLVSNAPTRHLLWKDGTDSLVRPQFAVTVYLCERESRPVLHAPFSNVSLSSKESRLYGTLGVVPQISLRVGSLIRMRSSRTKPCARIDTLSDWTNGCLEGTLCMRKLVNACNIYYLNTENSNMMLGLGYYL